MPNDNVIDKLSIEIEAQTGDVTRRLGKVVSALKVLSNTLAGMSMPKLGIGKATIANLNAFQTALQSLDLAKLSSLSSILSGMKGLRTGISSASAANITNFSQGIKNLDIAKLQHLSSINFSNLQPLAKAGHAISALNGQLAANANATGKVETAQKRLSTATHSVRRATHSAHRTFSLANTALGKLFNSIKRIAFYRVIRSAIKSVTQGFAEGIENLYRWSQAWGTSFAPAMDQLKTAQLYLKNGFASMFSPLIEYAVPIIDRVVDKIVDMFNAVQELFAQLTGAATWNKAIKYPVKYKDDLDAAAGSAKALQNILMDFDEINAINTPNSGSRGSGKEAEDYSKMFELVQTSTKSDSALSKFMESLNKLNFDPLKNSLKNLWKDGISPILSYFGENADNFLSPLAKFFVEEGLPTAIDLVTASLKPLLDIVRPLFDSGFFEDIAGKLSKVNGTVKKFADFLGTLDFSPIGEALASLWNNTLSPIIDKLIQYADFIQTNVLQPITQFLVEKGIPAAIGAIESALSAIWSILEPILDGLKIFWSENGGWIMELFEGQTMTALGKIKEAFGAIGKFFQKNGDKVKSIFSNLSKIIKDLSPAIKKIVEMIGTATWDSFVDTIQNILTLLQPILDLASGILNLFTAAGDKEKAKKGLKEIGQAIWDGLKAPFEIVLRVLASVLDTIGHIFPGCKEAAHAIRVLIGDEIDEVNEKAKVTNDLATKTNRVIDEQGNYVSITGAKISAALDEQNQKRALEIQKAKELGVTTSDMAKEMTEWYNYCSVNGLDPLTGRIIFTTHEAEVLGVTVKRTGTEINNFTPRSINNFRDAMVWLNGTFSQMSTEAKKSFMQTEDWAIYCKNWGIDPLTGAIVVTENTIARLKATPFKDVADASAAAKSIIGSLDDEAKVSFTGMKDWAQWCKKYGLDPLTGEILDAKTIMQNLQKEAENATARVTQVFKNTFSKSNGGTIGEDFARGFADALQSALNRTNFTSQIDIQEVTHQTVVQYKKMVNLEYEASKNHFASGGFPDPGSLFYAGEGGVPELMGTVGGRTAVAGGMEITGIREAIVESGQREEGLLRQLISAVANKDLTLVANSKTGRWVNQSLKAYAGVTG